MQGAGKKNSKDFFEPGFRAENSWFPSIAPIAVSGAKRHGEPKCEIRGLRIGLRRWPAWWRRLTAGRGTHRSMPEFVRVFESEPLDAEPRRIGCGDGSEETVVAPAAFDRLRATVGAAGQG